MTYKVELTTQAQLDLLQIFEYFASKVDHIFAEKKLVELEQTINSLLFQPIRAYKPYELNKIQQSNLK